MHGWHNLLHVCTGADCWRDQNGQSLNDDHALFEEVISVQKPLGDFITSDQTTFDFLVGESHTYVENLEMLDSTYKHVPATTEPYGDEGETYTRPEHWRFQLAQHGTLGELFDLGAVVESYRVMMIAGNIERYVKPEKLASVIEDRLHREADKSLIKIFASYDWPNWGDPADIVLTGLILGYPLQSTYDRIFNAT
jgi:hypothetical protein